MCPKHSHSHCCLILKCILYGSRWRRRQKPRDMAFHVGEKKENNVVSHVKET
ncbi:hypothetical protein HanOQP8_Chr09g0335271 [Helianthus annuus]|nr:hypothetical protein HanOQP8_Chr09g0335271 [Helianthus annuus]